MFCQAFDQIIGQGFDQGLGERNTMNTVYSSTRPQEEKPDKLWKLVKNAYNTFVCFCLGANFINMGGLLINPGIVLNQKS